MVVEVEQVRDQDGRRFRVLDSETYWPPVMRTIALRRARAAVAPWGPTQVSGVLLVEDDRDPGLIHGIELVHEFKQEVRNAQQLTRAERIRLRNEHRARWQQQFREESAAVESVPDEPAPTPEIPEAPEQPETLPETPEPPKPARKLAAKTAGQTREQRQAELRERAERQRLALLDAMRKRREEREEEAMKATDEAPSETSKPPPKTRRRNAKTKIKTQEDPAR